MAKLHINSEVLEFLCVEEMNAWLRKRTRERQAEIDREFGVPDPNARPDQLDEILQLLGRQHLRTKRGPFFCYDCRRPLGAIERRVKPGGYRVHTADHRITSVAGRCEMDGHSPWVLTYAPEYRYAPEGRCALCDEPVSPDGPFYCSNCRLPMSQIDRVLPDLVAPHSEYHRINNVSGICARLGGHRPADFLDTASVVHPAPGQCALCNADLDERV